MWPAHGRQQSLPRHQLCPSWQAKSATGYLTPLGALLRPQTILTFMLQEVQTALEGKEEGQLWRGRRETVPAGQLPCPCSSPSYSVFHFFNPQILLFFLTSCTSKIFLPLTALSLDGLVCDSSCSALACAWHSPPQAPPEPEGPQLSDSVLSSDEHLLLPIADFKNECLLVKTPTERTVVQTLYSCKALRQKQSLLTGLPSPDLSVIDKDTHLT